MSSCDHVDTLVSEPRGPFYGPLAHGFACGPHIPIHNAQPWNALVDPATGGVQTRAALAVDWGITNPARWREQVDQLLAGENIGPDIDVLLQLRRDMLGRYGRCDLPMWRDAVDQWSRGRDVPAELPADFARTAGVITRYEARFRADDLLPLNGIVNSVLGYDFGRAVNMARWGFGARYCDYRTAESIIVRAGQLTRQYYVSWADFGAGYALGRVLRFDNEEYGHTYDSVAGPHRMLMTDPASPWRHIPF